MRISAPVLVTITLVTGFVLGRASGVATSPSGVAAQPQFPPGIYPETGNRLPLVERRGLDEFGRAEYDEFEANIRTGRLLAGFYGPGGIRLHSPRVSDGLLRSNFYLRFDSPIGRRTYELAVLTTARDLDHQFEWTAHEPAALREGLEAAVVDVVKFRRSTNQLARRDALVIEVGRQALGGRAVSLTTFNEALREFGQRASWMSFR